MELVNARETLDSSVTMAPWGMASLNETLFTEAVTTVRRQCRWAAMAAQRSIQLSSWPPKRLFRLLVSFGKTISVITVSEAEAGIAFIRGKSKWPESLRAAPSWPFGLNSRWQRCATQLC